MPVVVTCPLANAVDRTLNLPYARAYRRQRIRYRQAKIVVAVRAQRDSVRVA